MNKSRYWRVKLVMIFVLGLVIMVLSPATSQEIFPSRPMTIVLPTNPGGSQDLSSRIVASQLENELGVSVVILNKPGGGASGGRRVCSSIKTRWIHPLRD